MHFCYHHENYFWDKLIWQIILEIGYNRWRKYVAFKSYCERHSSPQPKLDLHWQCSSLPQFLPNTNDVQASHSFLLNTDNTSACSCSCQPLMMLQPAVAPSDCRWHSSLQLFLYDRWSCYCQPSHLLATQPYKLPLLRQA